AAVMTTLRPTWRGSIAGLPSMLSSSELLGDRVEHLGPRLVERLLALLLEASGERVGVHPGVVERLERLLGVTAVDGQRVAGRAVVGEREQRLLRHRVDRERGDETLDVEDVGGIGVLGP